MQETDLSILSTINETLSENPDARQREIASRTSLSLGMTNAVLRRFAEKGWIMMRRISTRNIRYVLTPAGMNELARRSARYMRRTFSNIRDCYDSVEEHIRQAKKDGYTSVILYGESDISFLIDYACRQERLPFSVVRTLRHKPRTEAEAAAQVQAGPESIPKVPAKVFGIVSELACCGAEDALLQQGCIGVYELAGKGKEEK